MFFFKKGSPCFIYFYFCFSHRYRHEPFQHCPQGETAIGKCYCDPSDNFDYQWLDYYYNSVIFITHL